MANIIFFVIAFIAGGITAFLYLWMLHLSVKSILRKNGPAWFAFLGFFFRLLLCAACFFLVSWGGHFDRMAVSVIGFTIVRVAAVNIIKTMPDLPKKNDGGKQEKK